MEKNLPVPYKSQHGPDSKGSNADCGPASLAMVMEFLGKPHSVGGVLGKLGNPTGFVTIQQLAKVAQSQGFNVESKVDATFNELKSYIDKGLPVIVVGGYGYLNSTQDKEFKGSHIMVVVGYRQDDSVYVNDPDFWGKYIKDGDHHVYTGPEFFTFWRNEGNKEGNQANILFVVSKKPEEIETIKVRVTSEIGLRVRTQPVIAKNILESLPKGTEIDVLESLEGPEVNGTNNWYKIQYKSGVAYVWAGGTELVEKPAEKLAEEPAETPPEAPNVVIPDTGEYLKGIQAIYEITKEILESANVLPVNPKPIGFWQKVKQVLRIA